MRFDPKTRVRGLASGSSQVINWMAQPLVRSVQRGTFAVSGLTADATLVTPVLQQNSVLSWLGDTNPGGGTDVASAMPYLSWVDGSTIRATRGNNTTTITVGYEVVEYLPGVLRSNQSGAVTMTGIGTSWTATLSTAVTPSKTLLVWLGTSVDVGTAIAGYHTLVDVTDATTITASASIAVIGAVGFQVVEFN